MRFCIESKYFSTADGARQEVRIANTTGELLQQLRAAMKQPGWSDSVLVNARALPGPAADAWRRRAASLGDRTGPVGLTGNPHLPD